MTARDAIIETFGNGATAEKSSKVGDGPTVAKNAQVGSAEPPTLSALLESGELCKCCFCAKFQRHGECDQSLCGIAYQEWKEENGWEN